jgi:hypothetical protein
MEAVVSSEKLGNSHKNIRGPQDHSVRHFNSSI